MVEGREMSGSDSVFGFRISCFEFRVWASGSGFRVSGFGFGFWVSGFGFVFRVRVLYFGLDFRVLGSIFGFRVSGSGFEVSDFGFRVSGFGFRVSGFGYRISGLEPCRRKTCPCTFPRTPRSGKEGGFIKWSNISNSLIILSNGQTRLRRARRSGRSFRFFELLTQADTGNCSVERPCFLSDHIRPPCTEYRGNRLKGILNRACDSVPSGGRRREGSSNPRPSSSSTTTSSSSSSSSSFLSKKVLKGPQA